MARNEKAREKSAKKPPTPREDGPRIVGDPVRTPLDDVEKNPWNPNEMTAFEQESLKDGLQHDGWLASLALTIWGTDEKGRKKNLIIDGEHRWTVAKQLGFKEGPMVFLHGVTEAQAKALTIKLNAKRGSPNEEKLKIIVKELELKLQVPNLSLDLGIEQEKLSMMLAAPPLVLEGETPPEKNGTPPGEMPSGMTSHVRMVQLFFNEEQHNEFLAAVKKLGPIYFKKDPKKQTSTDITMEAIRRAVAATES